MLSTTSPTPCAQVTNSRQHPTSLPLHERHIHLDGGEALTELIVQLARQAAPLLLFDGNQPQIQRAPLRRRRLQRLGAMIEAIRNVIEVLDPKVRQPRVEGTGLQLRQCRLKSAPRAAGHVEP